MLNDLFVYIICVFKYISEKEKSTYGAEPNKLYGTFVSSSENKTEPENTSAISLNVNEFENKPLFPPPPPPPPSTLLPMGKLSSVSRPATLSNGQPMPRPSSPPPPPPPRQKRPRQKDVDESGQIALPPGMNPVMKAVVNNALGNLPLKRKSYVSRCEACNLVFNAESQERQHYTGKRHAKRMRMVAIEEKAGEMGFSVIMFNATFNNISVISWQSVLLVEETGVPRENHILDTSH